MKAVILAGGLGTRLLEETQLVPKPMVLVGGKPILWHILKGYSAHNINDFIICCGYKGYIIKEYFANYTLHMSDVTLDMSRDKINVHRNYVEPWRVTLVDTGEDTMTGGRLNRIKNYVKNETFCMTYGDGVSDVDVSRTIEFHKKGRFLATLTAVQPPERFGVLEIEMSRVKSFKEKSKKNGNWISGGFFVLEPEALKFILNDQTVWERKPLQAIAKKGKLGAFKHHGFWQCMDTFRDKVYLEDLWKSEKASWKVW